MADQDAQPESWPPPAVPGAAPAYPGSPPDYPGSAAAYPGSAPTYPGTSYPQPPPSWAPNAGASDGLGIAALVVGIVSLLGCWVPLLNLPVLVLAVVGIGLGIAAIVRANRIGASKGIAIAGLILSGLALFVGVAIDVAVFALTMNDVPSYNGPYDDYGDSFHYDDDYQNS